MSYPIPNSYETRKLIKIKIRKSAKPRGRAQLEAIKAKLEARTGHCAQLR